MALPLRLPADVDRVDLEAKITELEAGQDRLLRMLFLINERLSEAESRLPPPRFTVPTGWIPIKWASADCGYAEPTLYRWARRGRIVSVKIGGHVVVDPKSLPKRR